MHCVSETQPLPPVQVFDKTMVVKQLHVLEPQDLLITRADKGRLRPRGEGGYCLNLHQRLLPLEPSFVIPSLILVFCSRTVFTAHLLSHYPDSSLLFHLCHLSLCC